MSILGSLRSVDKEGGGRVKPLYITDPAVELGCAQVLCPNPPTNAPVTPLAIFFLNILP